MGLVHRSRQFAGRAGSGQCTNPPASPTGETQEVERVVVTGSLIPSAAEVGAAPVTTLDAAAVGRTGSDDPQVALQESEPAFTGGGNLGASNASIGSGSTNGGSEVSLRGLPTLVLLNGRRIADSAALAAGGAAFQDVNLFPASLIKRIEVLKDGASAIYGSDAVGGVVNVLLNDDFQGFAVDGRYGFAEKGNIHDQRYSAVAGFGDDKTRIVVAGQYQEQDPVLFTQRNFASANYVGGFFGGFDGYTTSNFGGKISVGGSSRYLATGLPAFDSTGETVIKPGTTLPVNSLTQLIPNGSITPVTVYNNDGSATVNGQGFSTAQLPAGAYTSGATNVNLADLGNLVGITLDQNRTNAYGSVERDIFDKHLTVFGDFLYSKNYSQSLLAPQPVATNSSPNASQNMVIPFGAPFNPFNEQIDSAAGAVTPGNTAVDGTGNNAGGIVVTNRFLGGPRVFRNDTDFYRIVAGLKGEIIKDYNYEVAFNHSQDDIDFKNFGLVRSDLLEQALAGGYDAAGNAVPATFTQNAGGQTVLATAAGPYSKINGVLYPALDAFAVNNPLSTERAILGTDIRDQQSKLTVIDGKLTGFPINLPAGPLGFAVGGEYRREELRLNDSSENFVASVPVADVEVGRDIEAGYAEISVPVISPSMKVPGIYSLDLDGAVRYEKYEDVNSAITPKASFVLRPTLDVAIRGTFSGSFNAPNLIETSGPAVAGFTTATNLGAGFTEQGNSIGTSNPNLGPTRSYTYSAGLVVSPHWVPGLTISADFFHVEEEGIIASPASGVQILQDANTLGSASPYNQFIHFGSPTGPNLTSTTPGQIQGNAADYFVVTSIENGLDFRESTVDFNFNYDHDFGPKFGGITLGVNGTYYLQAKGNDAIGGKNFDFIGLYLGADFGDNDFTPQYKLAPYVEYRYGGLSVSGLGNYIPSLRDGDYLGDASDRAGDYTTYEHFNLPKIRDYFTINSTISYEFGLNKPTPGAPATASKEGKDAKGGGDAKDMGSSKEVAKKMMALNLLDGLKLTFGVNNITNAKPAQILISPDFDNTDASIYDPFQRYYYIVVSKKF